MTTPPVPPVNPPADPPADPEDGGPTPGARTALKAIIAEVLDEKRAEWSAEPPKRTKAGGFLHEIFGM